LLVELFFFYFYEVHSMRTFSMSRGFAALVLCCLSSAAPAAIVYVDAVSSTGVGIGNTTINGSFVDTTASGNATNSTGGSATDNKWNVRPQQTNVSYNGTGTTYAWEADTGATSVENTPDLITTITLPGPGTYNLYGLFWSSNLSGGYYDAAFRVGSVGPFSNFDKLNSPEAAADGSNFAGTVLTRTNTPTTPAWSLYIADLGQFTFGDALPTVDIYVNGPDRDLSGYNPLPSSYSATNFNVQQRTLYDGVGYQVVPEPASCLLLCLAAIGGVAVRLKSRRS
jgi:hypothetical protein